VVGARGAGALTAARLQSERLTLMPMRSEHAAALAVVLGDPALHRFTGGEPEDVTSLRQRLERQSRGSPVPGQRWCNWVVRRSPAGPAIGTMQATVTVGPPATAELAWVIAREHQGRGCATEAAALAAAWLRDYGVGRLRAHIHPEHKASMAVARAIGLTATNRIVAGEVLWEAVDQPL
jgi:RimJ/RimL family protein N-acetyltransferase